MISPSSLTLNRGVATNCEKDCFLSPIIECSAARRAPGPKWAVLRAGCASPLRTDGGFLKSPELNLQSQALGRARECVRGGIDGALGRAAVSAGLSVCIVLNEVSDERRELPPAERCLREQ
ncbi:hypothetical protein SKAU_G00055050 [Synaphobranchus kaupii]|uniref:Uncharacterized protein n=1 Tax=Synaphobranchus kaupii TaxID=118154 RepID=A0A9Q1JA59_SYNKA|nr:hypothetical protein SKAU_G00055050 [Synaphobranchus kaupii]